MNELVCLELTPPVSVDESLDSIKQFFNVLHGFYTARGKNQEPITLEVVSTKADGIRYIARLDKNILISFHHLVTSYLPEVNVRQVPDYLIGNYSHEASMGYISQSKHYAYPLKTISKLYTNDPMTYITGAMTKLENNELIVYRLKMSAANPKDVDSITSKILSNEDLSETLTEKSGSFSRSLVKGLNKLSFMTMDLMTEAYHGSSKQGYSSAMRDASLKKDVLNKLRPARAITGFESELNESIRNKVAQPLFNVEISVSVASNDSKDRLSILSGAFGSFSKPGYQTLQSQTDKKPKKTNILSVSELATLYHFPNIASHKTENVIKSLSRTLPAPVSLKDGSNVDVIFGFNNYHGTSTQIGLTEEERERHVYIIGGTGNGKTTMLQYAIVQDVKAGKGLAVIDPHGDMAETILKHISEDRINDVIYFNPDDIYYPFGLNLLELPEGLNEEDLTREKDLVTESVISVFRKIFSDEDTGGHRIEYVLRNAIQTALCLEKPTLFTVFSLINDTKFRSDALKKVDNKDLKNFWKNELGKAGQMQKVKMSAGITAKIGRFLFSASAKRILEQPTSTLDFDDIINSGKILICNFSKGLLGEDTSELFGVTILAKLQLASLRRARIKQVDRKPFYLYVDEFQNFATPSFVQMLSESRKYKVFITMAEQSTSQQKDTQMVNIIMANVGSVIAFRSASPADEFYLLPLFSPYIEKGDLMNLPSYSFYMRIAAKSAKEPLSGETLLLSEPANLEVAQEIVNNSRRLYATQSLEEPINPINEAVEKESDASIRPEDAAYVDVDV